jgi:hypothetical protein
LELNKKSDLEWEAKNDVDTLIRAQEILADGGRKKRALAEIEKRNTATAKAEAQLERKTSDRIKDFKKKL